MLTMTRSLTCISAITSRQVCSNLSFSGARTGKNLYGPSPLCSPCPVIRPIFLTCGGHRRYAAVPGKKLFTPGPLGTSELTKAAMLRDLGSRDVEFVETVKHLRSKMVEIAGVSPSDFTCIPVQGSGTYAVESVFQSTGPKPQGKALLLENGAYGKRMQQICQSMQLPYQTESFPENQKVDPSCVKSILKKDNSFTMVGIVHCETSSGVINPVEEVGQVVKQLKPDVDYFVDAMSSFGAIPVDLEKGCVDFLVTSANKCLEGVPGFSLVIARIKKLLMCEGFSRSLSLDLFAQYQGLEKNGQFRFTPPTHSMLAFKRALEQFEDEGGVAGRAKRYQENRDILRKGMKELGFEEFLDENHEGYIITSYHYPDNPNFNFNKFYQLLNKRDQVIYPGKVLDADCFRIGSIGYLFPDDVRYLLKCITEVSEEMGVKLTN